MQQWVEVNDKEVGTPLPKKLGIVGDLVFAVVPAWRATRMNIHAAIAADG